MRYINLRQQASFSLAAARTYLQLNGMEEVDSYPVSNSAMGPGGNLRATLGPVSSSTTLIGCTPGMPQLANLGS